MHKIVTPCPDRVKLRRTVADVAQGAAPRTAAPPPCTALPVKTPASAQREHRPSSQPVAPDLQDTADHSRTPEEDHSPRPQECCTPVEVVVADLVAFATTYVDCLLPVQTLTWAGRSFGRFCARSQGSFDPSRDLTLPALRQFERSLPPEDAPVLVAAVTWLAQAFWAANLPTKSTNASAEWERAR